MRARPVVIRSINQQSEMQCVDVFRRPDGSFGFEEYRREPEDGRGWFPIGGYSDRSFATAEKAIEQARADVAWLAAAIDAG